MPQEYSKWKDYLSGESISKLIPQSCLAFNIPYGHPDWYKFRSCGVGGSEISTIASVNKYGSPVKIYHQKLGTISQDFDTEQMFHGRMLENYIADLWQYWDGSDGSIMKNYKAGNKIRNQIDINAYVVNEKYPWLFASVDRLIEKGGVNMINLSSLDRHGILELKTLSYWAERAWEDGFPKYYETQVQAYMAIMETDYSEVAVFKQGQAMEIHPIEAHKEVQQAILDITHDFYYNHVEPGLKAKKMLDEATISEDYNKMEEAQAMIDHYEPEPDPSEAYKQHMSDTFIKEKDEMLAPEGVFEMAKESKFLKELINELEVKRKLVNHRIVKVHNQNEVEQLSFGDADGYTRYYIKKGNNRYEFANNIKLKPSPSRIQEEIDKINMEF